MERNQLIGFALIFALLMTWSYLNRPDSAALLENETSTENAINSANQIAEETYTAPLTQESQKQASEDQEGEITPYRGKESNHTISNELFKVSISNKGAVIKNVELANFDRIYVTNDNSEAKEKVQLFNSPKNTFNYLIPSGNQIISSEDLYFETTVTSSTIDLRAALEDNKEIKISYGLKPESYIIDYNVSLIGFVSKDENELRLYIENYLGQLEKNVQFEKRFSTIYFKEQKKNPDYCSCTGNDEKTRSTKPIEWVSFANQFFNTSILPTNRTFSSAVMTTNLDLAGDDDLKKTSVLLTMGGLTGRDDYNMQIYMGPNEYSLLKAFNNDLEDVIPFGNSLFGDINRHVIRPFFDFLSKYIGSKGLVIIIMIFIIKMVLYPLTYKMLHSQAKMGALKPRLADLKLKHKDDMQKQQMETMKIYQEYGVSPFSGCIPMVAQMPIWYALFRFFPASITFRQESFLWASDLSSYDEFLRLPFYIPSFGAHLSLFTVLWAISTVVYTYYNMRHMDMSANPAMKYAQYLMPVMFFIFFNNYASGLTCYMFFSNMFNIAQTVVTKALVFDDAKILAQLDIQKAKPKKVSGFQVRLQEAMRQQQQVQEERNKGKTAKKK